MCTVGSGLVHAHVTKASTTIHPGETRCPIVCDATHKAHKNHVNAQRERGALLLTMRTAALALPLNAQCSYR
jgi:hypothetical protein